MKRAGWLAAMAASLAVSLPAGARPAAPGCDRACLTGVVDAYLQAMVAHDPRRAPFARGAKFTENTSILPFSEGLWLTATAIDPYRILVLDPETAQAAYVGVVREHGREVLLAARIKAPGGRIAEVETVVARDLAMMKNLRTPRAPIMAPLAPGERVPRDRLIAAANAYFDGIEQSNGRIIPFDKDCNRLKNGLQTTNNPDLMAELAAARARQTGGSAPTPLPRVQASAPPRAPMPRDCEGQIDSGAMGFISKVTPRRGYVVDEVTGTVFGLFMFVHRGDATDIRLKDGSTMPSPFGGQPWNMQMAELFKTRRGRIWLVEAIGTPLPFGARTGWE